MTFYTSDLHFGHENILKLCNRPFSTAEEMDEALIANWNKKVHKNDVVYILGDVVWKKSLVAYYMDRLKGKKILIAGNHDVWVKDEATHVHFDKVLRYLEINLEGHPMTMCHYPMLEWKSSRKDGEKKLGFLIHGHIHNRVSEEYRPLYIKHNALNCGVDLNGFAPVTFSELMENNMRFKLAALTCEEDRALLLSDCNTPI